nr:Flp pilus assembly complex ATPase component TadA [Actinomycetes bacterium]
MSLPKEEFTFVAMPQGEAAPASAPEQPVAQPVVQRAEPRAAAPVIAVQQPTVQQPVMQAVPEAPEPGQAPSMAAAPVAEPVAPPVAQPVAQPAAQPAEQPVQQPVEQAPVQAEPPVAAAVDQLAATPVGVEQPPVAAAVTEAPAPDLPPAAGEEGVVAEAAAVHHGHESEINLDEILVHMLEVKASDLHLTENAPPMVRVQGDLQPVPGYGALDSTQLQQAIYAILTDRQKQRFEEDRELDLAYELPGAARFRVNVMQQQGSVGAVLRTIPWDILPLSALRMPEILGDFADLPRGLVLVTGPTGSGKSTTLAAIIDQANRTRHGHI